MTTVVWFKRDLRVSDHTALAAAADRAPSPLVCLFVYEDELIDSPEFTAGHLGFINESLRELSANLESLGNRLVLRRGRMPDVLENLHGEFPFKTLLSHEETGNRITYDRDRHVSKWCRHRGVDWTEFPQNGVVRRLRSRDGWSARWKKTMSAPLVDAPKRLGPCPLANSGSILGAEAFHLEPSTMTNRQKGGELKGIETLQSFLAYRGINYRKDMSSPLEGWESCSRISPHLAWGTLSIRTAYHAHQQRLSDLRELKNEGKKVEPGWFGSLQSFGGRLRWHCHFMQKLEDQPSIEFENFVRAYDGLRENDFQENHFEAWCQGQTGYPMVDACMRALHQTGWINFRMRAMMVSFSSYHLWLHWRRPAVYLAGRFLDFEPGIHFSQFQMQSGMTGINTIRIYSPIKQVADQDPDGVFIRRWLPELAEVPKVYLAEPHKMPRAAQEKAGCRIRQDYPAPIVDHKLAYGEAKRRMFRAKGQAEAKSEAKRVYKKHGSRRRPISKR
ncbi:MAG: deoxyribodipyrimidine photo-lyase/cryptochrome family protein [Verrucomicrobiota bacterium]